MHLRTRKICFKNVRFSLIDTIFVQQIVSIRAYALYPTYWKECCLITQYRMDNIIPLVDTFQLCIRYTVLDYITYIIIIYITLFNRHNLMGCQFLRYFNQIKLPILTQNIPCDPVRSKISRADAVPIFNLVPCPSRGIEWYPTG